MMNYKEPYGNIKVRKINEEQERFFFFLLNLEPCPSNKDIKLIYIIKIFIVCLSMFEKAHTSCALLIESKSFAK
jgi:hypothetical protein